MSADAIDKQISKYLNQLNTKQKKAVLTVVKSLVEEEEVEYVKTPTLNETEIERRFKDLESGKVKGVSFEQLAEGARKAYRNKKKK
jgi:hypothetical protein